MARFFSSQLPEEEIRRLYVDEGQSTTAVATSLGCSETAVRNRLVALGIVRRVAWDRQAVSASTEEMRQLYVKEELSLSAVATRASCSLTTVWRRLTAAGVKLRADGSSPKYERSDFSGDLVEMAYLIGFRLGDLHVEVEGNTVVVKCTSTRQEQVELFRTLFEPYGRVYTDEATMERRQRKSVGMYARLNRTFEFLVPKQDRIPEWIQRDELAFYAAGGD